MTYIHSLVSVFIQQANGKEAAGMYSNGKIHMIARTIEKVFRRIGKIIGTEVVAEDYQNQAGENI